MEHWVISSDGDPEENAFLQKWVEKMAGMTSLHGFIWYNRVKNPTFRGILVIMFGFVIIGLPVAMAVKLVAMLQNPQVQNNIEFVNVDNITYPNITVCHTRYFDKKIMEGRFYNFCKIIVLMRKLNNSIAYI